MPTVQELYELWADDADCDDRARAQPRAARHGVALRRPFAALGPKRGELVARRRRAGREGMRSGSCASTALRAIALDPVPLHASWRARPIAEAGLTDEIEVVEAAIESMPLDDASRRLDLVPRRPRARRRASAASPSARACSAPAAR